MNIEIVRDTFIAGVYYGVGDTPTVADAVGEYLVAIGRAVQVSPTSVTLPEPHMLKPGMWIALSPFSANCEIKKITAVDGQRISFSALVNTHADSIDVFVWRQQPAFNVRYYGAVGDDTTNDTAAWAAAFRDLPSTGGDIYVPAGEYLLDLDVTANKFRLFGDGLGSIIKPYTLESHAITFDGCAETTLSRLNIDGRWDETELASGIGGDQSMSTLEFDGVTDCLIEHCLVQNTVFRGLDFQQQTKTLPPNDPKNLRLTIRNCHFKDSHRDPMFIGNAGEVWILSNLIEDAPDIAIDCYGLIRNIRISDNTILSCKGGVYCGEVVRNLHIINNVFDDCTGHGIQIRYPLATAVTAIVANNLINGVNASGSRGIHCAIAEAVITANTIKGFGDTQLYITGRNPRVYGNRFDNPLANYGIYLSTETVTIPSTSDEVTYNATGALIENNEFDLGDSASAPTAFGGIYCDQGKARIRGNNFYAGDPAIELDGSDYSLIANNEFDACRAGIFLTDSDYCRVDSNVFRDTVLSDEIAESGTSDNNLIRGNDADNAKITISGAATVIQGFVELNQSDLNDYLFAGATFTDPVSFTAAPTMQLNAYTLLVAKRSSAGTAAIVVRDSSDNQIDIRNDAGDMELIAGGNRVAQLYASTKIFEVAESVWNGGHLRLGSYHLWIDSTGDLRIKSGAPSSDTDGTVVGTQS